MPSSVIKNICSKWSEVQSFVEKYHPNKVAASSVVGMFNDNVLSHYRKILKWRQKQTYGHVFSERAIQSQVALKDRREIIPEKDLPEVFMEGDSSSKQ